MGQLPFYPPNVSGWPTGNRWLSASFALARASVATQNDGIAAITEAADPVAAALKRASLYEVTPQTRAAMTTAAGQIANRGTTRSRPAGDGRRVARVRAVMSEA